jgi:carbon storage regulator
MLVLGRKTNESVMIGDDIVVTILGVDGDRVKIGIKAPSSVRILRQELYETVKAENVRAANLSEKLSDALMPSLSQLFQDKE